MIISYLHFHKIIYSSENGIVNFWYYNNGVIFSSVASVICVVYTHTHTVWCMYALNMNEINFTLTCIQFTLTFICNIYNTIYMNDEQEKNQKRISSVHMLMIYVAYCDYVYCVLYNIMYCRLHKIQTREENWGEELSMPLYAIWEWDKMDFFFRIL